MNLCTTPRLCSRQRPDPWEAVHSILGSRSLADGEFPGSRDAEASRVFGCGKGEGEGKRGEAPPTWEGRGELRIGERQMRCDGRWGEPDMAIRMLVLLASNPHTFAYDIDIVVSGYAPRRTNAMERLGTSTAFHGRLVFALAAERPASDHGRGRRSRSDTLRRVRNMYCTVINSTNDPHIPTDPPRSNQRVGIDGFSGFWEGEQEE
ncbi:hypothetical protein BJ875DRAFT_1190 [Amylocarpus encephaloides]|uniref:Uncharacterized protein n=1 Tax=Amylocarpus encephaloides TaxID=45428 RepID=A0A9P7YUM7_9HELO|nr:hypothetical protein BJ875DRAFT_1190 [Amylocarpus encephaloides]